MQQFCLKNILHTDYWFYTHHNSIRIINPDMYDKKCNESYKLVLLVGFDEIYRSNLDVLHKNYFWTLGN